MKKRLLIVCCLLIGVAASAQINFYYLQTDSLKQELLKAKDDTSRVLLMANLAEAYRWSNPDSAMYFGQGGLKLAKEINFIRGEVNSLTSISVVERELGNLAKALNIALNALSISKEHHFVTEQVFALFRVANVYYDSKNYPKSQLYYLEAEALSQSIHNLEYENIAQWLIAADYTQMGKLDSAKYYADKALKNLTVGSGASFAYGILGDMQVKLKNDSIAFQYYRMGLQEAKRLRDYRTEANINISLAKYFKEHGPMDSAILYAKNSLSTAQFLSYKNRIISSSEILAAIYETKDPKEALKYYKIYTAAKDSLYGPAKMQALQTSVMEEQEKQKEIENAKLAYQNRVRQFALIAGLVVFLFIMLILYRNNRKKQAANKLLHQQKIEIQETLTELKTTQAQLVQSEKMASLGELTAGIAHEIQNPLNFVNNFSEVNDELIKELKVEAEKGNLAEVKAIAKDIEFNSEKINHHGKRADAIVKGMLQHSRTSSGQKEPTDINALADEYLRLAYHGLRAKDKSFNATTKTEFDNSISKIKVVPQEIGRVILNLINNAFYAVGEKQKGNLNGYEPTVTISTTKQNGKVEIKVKDNGNGIPQKVVDKIFQPFFTTKPTGQGTGLGLSLAYDIITKGHGGELKVETKEGEGSQFTIIL